MGNEAVAEKDDLTADQLDEIIESTDEEIGDEEEAAAFEAEFNNETVKELSDDDEESDEAGKEATEAEKTAAEKDESTESSDDEEEEDPVAKRFAALEDSLRKVQGKNGELNARLRKLSEQPVVEAPTKKQLEEAMEDDEKLALLKEEFPEQFDGHLVTAKLVKADILGSLPDNAKLTEDVLAQVDTLVDRKVLAITHQGWENTVKSEEFKTFAYTGGPSEAELAVYNAAEPDRAGVMFDGFIDKYPEWGESFGVLLKSDDISDVTKMLDQFEDSKTAQDEETKKTTKKQNRLQRNVAATKSSSVSPTKRQLTEEDAFLDGYKNA